MMVGKKLKHEEQFLGNYLEIGIEKKKNLEPEVSERIGKLMGLFWPDVYFNIRPRIWWKQTTIMFCYVWLSLLGRYYQLFLIEPWQSGLTVLMMSWFSIRHETIHNTIWNDKRHRYDTNFRRECFSHDSFLTTLCCCVKYSRSQSPDFEELRLGKFEVSFLHKPSYAPILLEKKHFRKRPPSISNK